MTQKNSSFKFRTLVWNCCRRQSALFTLSALAMIITLPVYMVLTMQSKLRYVEEIENPAVRASLVLDFRDVLLTGAPATLALIALAVIAGIAMFRYLHVKNQTDFFHSLPITRTQLFLSHVLCGILAVVPAYLIGTALACAVCTAYGFADVIALKLLAYSVFARIAGFLLVYAVTVLAAIVCGHTLVSLLVCVWFQFGAFFGWVAINQLLYILYPARVFDRGAQPYWLSPPVQMCRMIETLNTLYYNNESVSLSLHPFRDACLIPALLSLIAAAAILALCWLLNQRRKSEHTGLSIAFPIIEQPFKLYMVTVVGVACGVVFQMATMDWTVMFLGIALGALVTACIVEIVYHLDFHSLFDRWRSLLVYAAVCTAVLTCMALDLTHWNSTLPDRDQIVSADLHSAEEGWNCGAYGEQTPYSGEVGGTLWSMAYLASDLMHWDTSYWSEDNGLSMEPMTSDTVIDAIYDSASIGAQAMTQDRSTIVSGKAYENQGYQVVFTLKNGKTFTRQYYMPGGTKQLSENGAAVRFSQEYRSTRTAEARAVDESFRPEKLVVKNYVNADQSTCDVIEQQSGVTSILNKLKEESAQLTQEYVSQHVPVLAIRAVTAMSGWDWNSISNLNAGYYESDGVFHIIDIPVYACETDTLKILRQYAPDLEIGYASEQANRVTVEYWDDEGNSISETYDDAETVAECMKHSYPASLGQIMDPIFAEETGIQDVRISMENGDEIYAYYYGDNEKLKPLAAQATTEGTGTTQLGVVGGADGPTAIAVTVTGGTSTVVAVVCLLILLVGIGLLCWRTKRRKRK